MSAQDETIEQIKKMVRENQSLRLLVVKLESLLACYRLGKHPSDSLLDAIHKLKSELQ